MALHPEHSVVGATAKRTQWIGGLEFVACDKKTAAMQIIDMTRENRGRHVHLANAYTVALASRSEEYSRILQEPAVNYPDGKPIGWVSQLRGHCPNVKQVRGPSLFLDVFDYGRAFNVRHYLLGSTPTVLKDLERNLKARFPGVSIVGSYSPPFRPLTINELREQDANISSSGAQIVWIGLGTPKQDFEASRLANELPVVAVAVGAAFDFAAGAQRQAPDWVSSAGLEWLFRLATEPRRLWRRYLFGNLRFLRAVVQGDQRIDHDRNDETIPDE
ncbi:WecB/TagA/CpsF family glycosyltransferase [Sinomonas sp. RB5]